MPDEIGPNGELHRINYQTTIERLESIQSMGYSVEQHWECTVNKQLNNKKEMRDFFNDCQTRGHIDPRDAYFGGFKIINNLVN